MATGKEVWTEEKCVELIREYRKKPILWDDKDPFYYKKKLKPQVWEKVAQSINVPADECKQKMIVLMSQFRTLKSKIMTSIRNRDRSIYRTSWFAFKELAFLLDKSSERKRQKTGTDLDDDDCNEDLTSAKKTPLNHLMLNENKRTRRLSTNTLEEEAECETSPTQTNTISTVETAAEKSLSESEKEIASFTKFLATKMKKYNESTKNAVQQAICEVIFKADQGLNESAPSSIQSPETNMTHDDIIFETVGEDEIECETIVIKEEYSESD